MELDAIGHVPLQTSHRVPELHGLAGYPTSQMPNELLSLVFELAWSPINVTSEDWSYKQCLSDLVDLYTLRRVCKLWKTVADATPVLWTLVSSTFSDEVNRTSLIRSGTCALSIYYGDQQSPHPRAISQPLPKFLSLIDSHHHRWGSVALEIPPEEILDVPYFSSQQMVALKIRLQSPSHGPSPELNWYLKISAETASQIEVLELVQVPMDQPQALSLLKRLRTLIMERVSGRHTTYADIMNTIAMNTGIETLYLIGIELTDTNTNSNLDMRPISLPNLKSILLWTDFTLATQVLKRVQVVPDIFKFDLRPRSFPTVGDAEAFWMETMLPWTPVVRQLHRGAEKAQILLNRHSCSLHTVVEGYCLRIEFTILPVLRTVQWIWEVFRVVTEGNFHVTGVIEVFEEQNVLNILQHLPGLRSIAVRSGSSVQSRPLDTLFNILGSGTFTSQDAHAISTLPSFPDLRALVLYDWRWGLDGLINPLRKRYSEEPSRPPRNTIPDIALDLTTYLPWSYEEVNHRSSRAIVPFETAKELRGLDGVKCMSLQCTLGAPGMLAVVWDEEKSVPSWR